MFRTLLYTFCLIFACIFTSSFALAQIVGEWKTVDDNTGKARSIIEIYEAKNGMYYGKVRKLLDPDKSQDVVCEKCPGDRKGQKVVGLTVIREMKLSSGTMSGGYILDPENGKEYSCKIWLEGNELKVRGYWGVFYRTQTWYKK
jgi:uncharacterized protein (DUF2147 family)